jgi:hypothetical protein
MQGDGVTASPTLRGDEVPANPGPTFTLTASVSANATTNITIAIGCLDSTGTLIANSPVSSSVTGGASAPTTLTASVTAPANTVSVRPVLAMTGTPPATTLVSWSSAVVSNAAGSATSSGVVVQSLGSCRLKDPLRPGNNVRVDFAFDPNPQCTPTEGVFFQSIDVESQAANSAAFNINNQAEPVVVSKVRSSIASTLTLVSRTFADRDRLNALLAPGGSLLFQVPDVYGLTDQMMSVGATSVSRVLPDHRFPIRVFSLPYQVTTAPGGPMQGVLGARWQDTCNRYATWAAVNAAGLTWVQVLDGAAG